MGNLKAGAWVVAFFLALGGCAALEPVSQKDLESHTYEGPHDLVFQAVVSVLTQKGHRIIRADQGQGIIDTEPVEAKYKRVKISAEVKPLGKQLTEVRARIELAERGLMSSTYKPERPKLTMYEDLFQEIELQVYREHFLKIERKAREKP